MDKLIQNADFFHDNDDKKEAYLDKLSDWKGENDEKVTGPQILSMLQALKKKLTQAKCPKYDTKGWTQAFDIYDDYIEKFVSEAMEENKLQAKDVRQVYYKLYLEWFQYGPSTIQLAIMEETFSDSDVDMEEYLKGLTGEPRNKLISAMMSPIQKKEDTGDEEFYENHKSYMDKFISHAFDKDSLLEKDMQTWLDYAFHLYLDYLHLSDDVLYHVLREAGDRFDDISDGWEAFSDVKCLKSLIGKITAATKSKGFPRGEEAARTISEPIGKLWRKLQKPGDAEMYSDSFFDLLEAVSQCKGEFKEVVYVFKEALRFFDDQDSKTIKNRAPFFKVVAPRYTKLLEKLDINFLQECRFATKIMEKLKNAYGNNKAMVSEWVAFIVPLLKRPCCNTLRAAYSVLSTNDQIRWKEHKEAAKEVFQSLSAIQLPQDGNKSADDFVSEYKSCVDYFLRGLKKARILKEYGEGLMFLGINILELKSHVKEVFELVEEIGENIEIDVKQHKDKVMEVMKRIHQVMKDDNMPWTESWPLQRAVEDTLQSIIDPVNDGRIFSDEDLKVFSSMCHTCLSREAVNPNDASLSPHFLFASAILNKMIEWMASTKRLGYAVKLIPLILSKYEEEEENVNLMCAGYLSEFATGEAATMTPHLEQLIKLYLEKEDTSILRPINTIYPFNPAPMKEHFQVMLHQLIDSRQPDIKTWMQQIFWTASKKQPELFTEKNMRDITLLAKDDKSNQAMLMQILQEVCKRKPEKMIKNIDLLMDQNGWDPMLYPWLNEMLCSLALYDKSQSNKVIDYYLNSVKTNQDKGVLLTALNNIRLVGFNYPDIIKPRRQDIASLQTADADGLNMKQTTLDMIDGKTPENIRKQMEEQQSALSGLVGKVEVVEEAVLAVRDDLGKQGQELDNVKNDVTQQGQRLDQVEETVDETVAKVEEIDSKTLSHAPYWSRDISKLINPATEHDWRLLSSRLGYSNADIRGWAQQADPCMAMLNEWYATRKTSEATYAILTNLQEMNRMDAALIVENAMKKAEAVVEDEEFEYASPPEIFLSYQWGHQEEVKLLQRHLAMAGYECWLDIGQMGGGDKLFEKIDNGMRAAKLVISCVTSKYAKSPNCNREVNLALGVNKPIIPLLLESCPWPPPGSMGPIFSESLYIQFYQTGKEETNDDRFWPVDKFQELLMQLSVNGLTPDEGKIDKVVQFTSFSILNSLQKLVDAIEEEIHIDKSKTRDGGKKVEVSQTEDSSQAVENPDVFISYQWGKQKNIIKLYQRLTSLGYSCWLDIKQMGGGDSLYDKIDRGIRGCKVVLSCVTKNYALSANCRREVSLVDALKKPMLPLLLEEMTWPPTGPMSMIMTQLLYIGFQQESSQVTWNGPQFDELISKINHHLPKSLTEHPITTTKKENKPAETNNNKAAQSNTRPAESSNKPSETNKKPAETSKRPSGSKPTESNSKPPVQDSQSEISEPTKTESTSQLHQPEQYQKDEDDKKPPSPGQASPLPPATPQKQQAKSKSCSVL